MANKKKGIEQFLPISIIFQGILDLAETGTVDRKKILYEVQQITKGENRAKKATNAIGAILENKSKITDILKKTSLQFLTNLSEREKNLLCIALISLRYPIMYDALSCLGKLFKLQEFINRQYLMDSLAEIYGANSTFHHAISAILEILVDAKIIERVKIGIYKKTENETTCDFINDTWIFVYSFINKLPQPNLEKIYYFEWFQFLNFF